MGLSCAPLVMTLVRGTVVWRIRVDYPLRYAGQTPSLWLTRNIRRDIHVRDAPGSTSLQFARQQIRLYPSSVFS